MNLFFSPVTLTCFKMFICAAEGFLSYWKWAHRSVESSTQTVNLKEH